LVIASTWASEAPEGSRLCRLQAMPNGPAGTSNAGVAEVSGGLSKSSASARLFEVLARG